MSRLTGWIKDERTPGQWFGVAFGEHRDDVERDLAAYIADADNVHPDYVAWCILETRIGPPTKPLRLIDEDIPCDRCEGTGLRRGKRCRNCNGIGSVGGELPS